MTIARLPLEEETDATVKSVYSAIFETLADGLAESMDSRPFVTENEEGCPEVVVGSRRFRVILHEVL